MKRVLCIWLPDWSIQRCTVTALAVRPRAELGSTASAEFPLVLYARDPRGGQRVVACSSTAHGHGVRVDMPVAEAKALVKHTTQNSLTNPAPSHRPTDPRIHRPTDSPTHDPLLFQSHDPQADRACLEKLAEWCEQFSPLVGLEVAEEPSSLLLDVTGVADLFGGEGALARRVVDSFDRRGYCVCVAIADTIGAAWAVAHTIPPSHGPFSIVASGKESTLTALGPLPLIALRLSEETIQLLHGLGIVQIGQLLKLPRASLISRFGNGLVQRLDEALGSRAELITAHRTPHDFSAQWPLDHPTHRREAIEQLLVQLVERIATLLNEQDRGAVQLECTLTTTPPPCSISNSHLPSSAFGLQSTVPIHVGLFQPTANASHLMKLVRLQLERLTLPGPVTNVSVQATTTAPLEVQQQELFADSRSRAGRQLALLVARLASRLGDECVRGVRLQADAQPERVSQYISLTRGGKTKTKRFSATTDSGVGVPSSTSNTRHPTSRNSHPTSDTSLAAASRPLRLLSPPLVLHVMAVAPDGPPMRFLYENSQHQVVRHWGPERIETGWWRGRSVRRDYYRVETGRGNRFWLFRRLSDGKWFLQGTFE